MMRYLLGKETRAATTNADQRTEAFADPSNVRWTTRGLRERRGEKKFYDYVAARLIEEQATRIFQRGDTVRMHVKKNEEYVGQILSIFEILKEDGTQGSDASTIMLQLKWMYRPSIDVTRVERKRSAISSPDEDELYWSDHVDFSPAESILGIAHLRQTRNGVKRTREDPPKNYWKETDKVYLCRTFYDSSDGAKIKSLRKLEHDELIYLLQNPTKEDQYDTAQLFRRHDAVLRRDEEGNFLYSEFKPVADEQAPNGARKKKAKGTHRRVLRCSCCSHNEQNELEEAATDGPPRKRARRLLTDEENSAMEEESPPIDDDDVSNSDVQPGLVVQNIQGAMTVEVEFENGDEEQTRMPVRQGDDIGAQSGGVGGNDEQASKEKVRPPRRRVETIEAQGAAPGSIAAARIQAEKAKQRLAEENSKRVKKEEEVEELEELDIPAPEGEIEEEDKSETALTGVMHSQEKEEDKEVKVEDTVEKVRNNVVGNNKYGIERR